MTTRPLGATTSKFTIGNQVHVCVCVKKSRRNVKQMHRKTLVDQDCDRSHADNFVLYCKIEYYWSNLSNFYIQYYIS